MRDIVEEEMKKREATEESQGFLDKLEFKSDSTFTIEADGDKSQFSLKMAKLKSKDSGKSNSLRKKPTGGEGTNADFDALLGDDEPSVVPAGLVHRDTLKERNKKKNYALAYSDSDDDDGELTDEDSKFARFKPTGHFNDAKYLRETMGMGGILNMDQTKSVEQNRAEQERIQRQEEERRQREKAERKESQRRAREQKLQHEADEEAERERLEREEELRKMEEARLANMSYADYIKAKVVPGPRDLSMVKKKINNAMPGPRDISFVKKKLKGGLSSAVEFGSSYMAKPEAQKKEPGEVEFLTKGDNANSKSE